MKCDVFTIKDREAVFFLDYYQDMPGFAQTQAHTMKPSELIEGLQILARHSDGDILSNVTVFGPSGVILAGPDKAPGEFPAADRERLKAIGWEFDGEIGCWWLKV